MQKSKRFIVVLVIFLLMTPSADAAYYYLTPALHTKMDTLATTAVRVLPIPVLGLTPTDLKNNWGESRGARAHEGIDIFAPEGTTVISVTDAVVIGTGFQAEGGNYVFTANPGDEKYYYAHLDTIASTVSIGAFIKAGDPIGTVGHTGNAEGGANHLHFGIYKHATTAPINPFPRLTSVPTDSLVLGTETLQPQAAPTISSLQKPLQPFRIMKLGMKGEDVKLLQRNLNILLKANLKADGFYGKGTADAVKRFQKDNNLIITGIAGVVTQAKIAELLNMQ